MLKRILLNITLAFGILPAANPLLVYLNAFIFGYAFSKNNFAWSGPRGFYPLYWGYVIFYYSVFILLLVLGIYNLCIIMKVRATKIPFSPTIKFILFLVIFSMVTAVSNSDFYYLGGHHILLQKTIVLIILSALTVVLHYFLIDKKYERQIIGNRVS